MSEQQKGTPGDAGHVDIVVDGDKGDTTVRPCRPELRAYLEVQQQSTESQHSEASENAAEKPIDIVIDGDKGDRTVRPGRASIRAYLEAEREALIGIGKILPVDEEPEHN